jgi:hypothetical protein
MGWVRHVACMGERRNAHGYLSVRELWKEETNVWMETVLKCESLDWIYLASDENQWWRSMNTVASGFYKIREIS